MVRGRRAVARTTAAVTTVVATGCGVVLVAPVAVDSASARGGDPEPASIGDFVWLDTDRDGRQDPDEPGIRGVAVRAIDELGDATAPVRTDADGAYLIPDLAPGDYVVAFGRTQGREATFADQPVDPRNPLVDPDTIDSDIDQRTLRTDPVVLTAGEDDDTVDAGFLPALDLSLAMGVRGPSRVSPGDAVTFALNVRNRGDDDVRQRIRFTSRLARHLELRSAAGQGWTCRVGRQGDAVSCRYPDLVRAGRRTPPVLVRAQVARSAPRGAIVNTAVLDPLPGDVTPGNGTANATVRVR